MRHRDRGKRLNKVACPLFLPFFCPQDQSRTQTPLQAVSVPVCYGKLQWPVLFALFKIQSVLWIDMKRTLIKMMAAFYGFFCALNLETWFLASPLVNKSLGNTFPAHFARLDFFLALASFFIMYSLWKLKWWARVLVIVFNLFWLAWLSIDLVLAVSVQTIREFIPMTRLICEIVLFGLITILVFRKDFKDLINKAIRWQIYFSDRQPP